MRIRRDRYWADHRMSGGLQCLPAGAVMAMALAALCGCGGQTQNDQSQSQAAAEPAMEALGSATGGAPAAEREAAEREAPSAPPAAGQPAVPALPPASEEVPPAAPDHPLRMARELVGRKATSSAEFQDALRQGRDQLTEIQVATDQPGAWTKVNFNHQGAAFDGIRFTSPLDRPADLCWVFGFPAGHSAVTWYITPLQGTMNGFRNFKPERHLRFEGVELPEQNAVFFQTLGGGEIQPGQEYVLWFAFNDRRPVDCYLMVKLIPAGTAPASGSAEAVATVLGLPLPLEHTAARAVSDLLARAENLAANRDFEQAIALAEQGREQYPDNRQALFLLARLNVDRGIQVGQADRAKCNEHLLKAAELMRSLRQAHGEFSRAEAMFWPLALYNEACAYATQGESERAMASLKESLAAGFNDLRTLEGDQDLTSIRSRADFQPLVDSLKAAAAQKR